MASSEDVQKQGSAPVKVRRVRNVLKRVWGVWVAAVLAAIVGLPAGAVEALLGSSVLNLVEYIEGPNSLANYTLLIGVRVGLGAFICFGVTVGTPWLWRHADRPAVLRLIASGAVQGYALGIGLFVPDLLDSFITTTVIAGVGNVTLWLWQRRWRGVGIAPTPLAGLLRPAIHPGQVWYATVKGSKETKVRPVVVLEESAHYPGRFIIAYCTTQAPRTEWMQYQYIHVPYGVIRGLPKETWISTKDLRELKRPNFRTYLGVAPEKVYREVCKDSGPVETALRNALGLEHTATPPIVDNATWETLKTLLFMPIDPPKKQEKHVPHDDHEQH
jgi:PemK-like, MazF-like toxin of type II toxin-antitoxin system